MIKPGKKRGKNLRLHLGRKLSVLGIWILVGIFFLNACTFPLPGPGPEPTLDPNAVLTQQAIITQAAETIAAQVMATFTQAALLAPTATPLPPSETPTEAFTPTLPSPTATSTLTPTVVISPTAAAGTPAAGGATSTATSASQVQLEAEFATNCRQGPGTQYDVVAVLPAGMPVEVFGRDRSSVWWYIRNPEDSAGYCWVWSGTTEVLGDASQVGGQGAATPGPAAQRTGTATQLAPTQQRTATPPPPSAGAFRVPSVNIHQCGQPRMIFGIENRSGQAFESVEILIEDLDGDRDLYVPASEDLPFLDSDRDCSSGADRLASGDLGYVGAFLNRTAAPGSRIRITLRFCTREDLEGACFERVIEFFWP